MKESSKICILCVPNLQGETTNLGLPNVQEQWLSIGDSLTQDVESLRECCDQHRLLLGSSYGALVVWKFVNRHRPSNVRGIVLVDVLPSLSFFPWWRRIALRMITPFPSAVGRVMYDIYGHIRGHKNRSDFVRVQRRLHSTIKDFPESPPLIPTLVLSSKESFHTEWVNLSDVYRGVTAQRKRNIAQQIASWLVSKQVLD